MIIYDDCCEKAGLDPKEVKRIAAGLSRYARQADALGISLFGGSGSGSLRFDDNPNSVECRMLILAHIDGCVDGGDGACWEDEKGLLRGE